MHLCVSVALERRLICEGQSSGRLLFRAACLLGRVGALILRPVFAAFTVPVWLHRVLYTSCLCHRVDAALTPRVCLVECVSGCVFHLALSLRVSGGEVAAPVRHCAVCLVAEAGERIRHLGHASSGSANIEPLKSLGNVARSSVPI